MKLSQIFFSALLLFLFSCDKGEELTPDEAPGSTMLLIGNSFFRPYADNLENVALDAGFSNHNANVVFRGGENGRPINFWNDSNSAEHQEIKAVLDGGGIEIFGMTAGADIENNTIDGHRSWIAYALQNNPEVSIFIAIPPIDFPAGETNGPRSDWQTLAEENGFNNVIELYDYYVNEIVHKQIVDPLRVEFPSTKIFTIPTGWATLNLAKMNQEGLLLDEIEMFGPKPTSIFTDEKGHQGQIVIETGTLVWLEAIYNVDLNTNSYETGFTTDLHSIANEISSNHDSNYK